MAGQRLGVAVDDGERYAEREQTVELDAKPEPLFFVWLCYAVRVVLCIYDAVGNTQRVAVAQRNAQQFGLAHKKQVAVAFGFSVIAAKLGGLPRLRVQRRRPRQPGAGLYAVYLPARVLRECELRGCDVAVGHDGVHAQVCDGVDAGAVRRVHVCGVRQPRRDAVRSALRREWRVLLPRDGRAELGGRAVNLQRPGRGLVAGERGRRRIGGERDWRLADVRRRRQRRQLLDGRVVGSRPDDEPRVGKQLDVGVGGVDGVLFRKQRQPVGHAGGGRARAHRRGCVSRRAIAWLLCHRRPERRQLPDDVECVLPVAAAAVNDAERLAQPLVDGKPFI